VRRALNTVAPGVAIACALLVGAGCGGGGKSTSSASTSGSTTTSSVASQPPSPRDITCKEVKESVRKEHALAHQVADDIKNVTNGTVIASFEFADRHVREACAVDKPDEKPYLDAVAGVGVSKQVIEALAKYTEE
jgi:hypothetical protein